MTSGCGRVPCEAEFTPPLQAPELADLPQAIFCRCACRFRWPEDARRHEQRTDTGELEAELEDAECPVCGSTLQRNLAQPDPPAYFDEPVDVVQLVAEWLSRRASSPPPASCERLRIATRHSGAKL